MFGKLMASCTLVLALVSGQGSIAAETARSSADEEDSVRSPVVGIDVAGSSESGSVAMMVSQPCQS